jgi:hypothetical protein
MEDGKPITITGMITIFSIPISFVVCGTYKEE